jgi:hypothetical protein
MMMRLLILPLLLMCVATLALAQPPIEQEPNTWIKRSPLKTAPVSPGMGYEASLAYDPLHKRVIRWGGHNQGGGGEQNAETWVLDPVTMKWELKEPNQSPPGVCCAQQNVFDPSGGRFLRFPAFSGSHGWHWFRENYLNNTAVWSYDLGTNLWRDMRPAPTPHPAPLRCASWDSHYQVAVVACGEGSQAGTIVYDPYTNTWTRMKPKKEPPPRSAGNMAYDAARKLHILFGSQFTDDPHTWAYDLANNEWRDMQPAVQPPTNRNDAVLAYDAAHQVVVAVVRVADKQQGEEILAGHLETWAYDAGKNTWQQMKSVREPDGWGNRRRVLVALPDQQLLLMEVYVNPTERVPGVEREQQVWTYRYGPIKPAASPQPPAGVQVVTQASGEAVLTWKAAPAAKAYKIYRGEGTVPWKVDVKAAATVEALQTTWKDTGLKPGTVYHYVLRTVDKDGRESDDSIRVRTQTRIVEDAVVSVLSAKEVQITWKPPATGADIIGYHIERAAVEVFSEDEVQRLKKDTLPLPEPSVGGIRAIGSFTRLTKEPIKATVFTDTHIDLAKPEPIQGQPIYTHRFAASQLDANGKPYRFAVYAYRVRAVNALGVESGPSPYFLTLPSAPQWLFAREEGTKCHLKWAVNAEKGLKGYRVYRMEGPRINGPGQKVTRLTVEALGQVQYTDEAAGKDTHRYWIVAVDALGQEGLPSSPAWHYRQYQKYYAPFVGPWHQ